MNLAVDLPAAGATLDGIIRTNLDMVVYSVKITSRSNNNIILSNKQEAL